MISSEYIPKDQLLRFEKIEGSFELAYKEYQKASILDIPT
jgi:hypothetical protein